MSIDLFPAIIQDAKTKTIYMVGYMNKEALGITQKTGWVCFWSRSRQRLWTKGETSNNKLAVKDIFIDCDNDAIVVQVELHGTHVCHTGHKTCFYTALKEKSYET